MTTTRLPLVLITGGSGYIGTHVVQQSLEAGYPVRLTARPGKVEALRNLYQGKVEVYEVTDLATGDYTGALKGVGVLVHVAAPLAGRESSEGMLKNAVDGTLNVVRQATASGVKRIVVTSSVIAMQNLDDENESHSNKVLTENDWNPVTREQVLSGEHDSDAFWVYGAVKTIAERELWKFADVHPEVDITTINPAFVYGPLAVGVSIPKGNIQALSTTGLFYANVLPPNASNITLDRSPQTYLPISVDVRDVARAHVLALRSPPANEVGRKRIPIAGPKLTWIDSVIHLRKVMPELASRLPKVAPETEFSESQPSPSVDTSRAKAILGLDQYISWQKTAEDTARSLLEVERSWGNAE